MRTGETYAGEREVNVEAMLSESEGDLLKRARKGRVPCPWCGRALTGKPVTFEQQDDEPYVGVRLSCSCGFVEY